MKLLTDHVWRPMRAGGRCLPACQFMNCRRPRAEHERAVSQVSRWRR